MRTGISLHVTVSNRERLLAIIDTLRYGLSRVSLTKSANYIANSGYQRMM